MNCQLATVLWKGFCSLTSRASLFHYTFKIMQFNLLMFFQLQSEAKYLILNCFKVMIAAVGVCSESLIGLF